MKTNLVEIIKSQWIKTTFNIRRINQCKYGHFTKWQL